MRFRYYQAVDDTYRQNFSKGVFRMRISEKFYGITVLALILILWAVLPCAAGSETNRLFASLQKRLVRDGFDGPVIGKLYGKPAVKFDKTGASLFFRHSEARLDYNQFATAESIDKAQAYMKKHKTELSAAEGNYGVDPKVITAIILVETRLGTLVGSRSVLNTLSTLASINDAEVRQFLWDDLAGPDRPKRNRFERWAERKSKWAYKELKSFLTYTLREKIDPAEIRGSYAGALGIAQFMPSSIMAYARDGNDDGRIDLFDHADAIASVANYLKRNGWRANISEKRSYKVIHSYNKSNYYVDVILKIRKLLEG
jgi:peptidoglycan lytic transglycosylase B